MSFIVIYVTFGSIDDARKLSNQLLKEKLIACVNYLPIESCYWWEGKIESSNEIVSLLKTRTGNWNKVKKKIIQLHPYDTPCIMKYDVESNESYEQWILKETK